MQKRRNYNLDIIRACATLLVVIYHSWTLTGKSSTGVYVWDTWVMLGGEIGVTAFFILSGYGIFCSLGQMEKNGGIQFFPFIKKRILRIVPQYYTCILVCFLLLDGAANWSRASAVDVGVHMLFLHNLFPAYSGSINGVLWTMGVIFQFYLIAIPLYKGIRRCPFLFTLGAIALTVIMKYIVFHYLAFLGAAQIQYFIYGRQLYTALDHFVLGMVIAYFLQEKTPLVEGWKAWILSGGCLVVVTIVCRMGLQYGIHTCNWSGYIWHTVLAIGLSGFFYFFSCCAINQNHILPKVFLWISKYEYSIYLWHLLMMNHLLTYNGKIQNMIANGQALLADAILVVFSVLLGYALSGDFLKGARNK